MDEARYREAERRLWQSVGASPTERRVALAGTGVEVRIQEVGDGPPVVFVHGGSTTGTSWAPLVALLDGFRCVVLDRPGCGLSDPLGVRFTSPAAFNAYADTLLLDVLDALAIDTAALVSTSYGGYFALRTAAAHPDRVERVIEYGFPIGAPMAGLPIAMRLTAIPGLGRLLAQIPPNERAVKAIYRQLGLGPALDDGRITAEAIGWFLATLRDTDTMVNELKAGPRLLRPVRGMDDAYLLTPDVLARVQAPVHFLWGTEDPFGGEDIARAFAAQLPNAHLALVPGGHAVWIDDPARAADTARVALLP